MKHFVSARHHVIKRTGTLILAACLTLSGMFTVYASTDETDPACAADFADDVNEMDAVCLDD